MFGEIIMIEELGYSAAEIEGEDKHHAPIYCMKANDFDDTGRIRSQVGEIKDFSRRLKEEGQLNPITFEWIDGKPRLNTGARRLYAALLLEAEGQFFGMDLPPDNPRRVMGVGYVLARDIGALDDIERLILELSENLNRKDFTKSEEALGMAKLQRLLEEKTGKPVRIAELAAKLKTSIGQVGMGLKVAQAINKDPGSDLAKKLLQAPSIKSSYDTLLTTKKLAAIKERIGKHQVVPEEAVEAINHPDGIAFLKSLLDESIDFIHFDPPWGVGIDDYDRRHVHETFNDDTVYAWDTVIYPMIPELYRVLKQDTWSVCWFGIQFYQKLSDALETLSGITKKGKGFRVDPVPGIWYKTNKGGSQNNPDMIELNVYEAFLRIRKGDPRLFKKPLKNVIECPMDYGAEREHFAQKPMLLCTELLERYTYSGMTVVDPTYGSGRIFKACQKLHRQFAGAEKNEENRKKAILMLRSME
jgi:DNA modification methylase